MFKKGVSGNPSGRPKGALGKTKTAKDIMDELGFCPIKHLHSIATNPEWTKREITQASVELAKYAYPALKSIDHNLTNADKVTVNLNLGAPPQDNKNEAANT